MRRTVETHDPIEGSDLPIQVIFDRHVLEYILFELERYPRCEEGGKYLGYLQPKVGNRGLRVIVTDFLPGGPRAKRSAVEFFPDGEFQERLFRLAEARDEKVEHLGTWHSHHCNGLDRLSAGDISGYFKTVSKAEYRPEAFIASLVKRFPSSESDEHWIDHFMFLKGHDRFYKITSDIIIGDFPTSFGDITGHGQNCSSRYETKNNEWYQTENGRKVLAEDKGLFQSIFGQVLATRSNGAIAMTCVKGHASFKVQYPALATETDMQIELQRGNHKIFSLCFNESERRIAYAASIAALDALTP